MLLIPSSDSACENTLSTSKADVTDDSLPLAVGLFCGTFGDTFCGNSAGFTFASMPLSYQLFFYMELSSS